MCLIGVGMRILRCMLKFGFGLSLLLELGRFTGDGAFLRVATLTWHSSWLCIFLGVGTWKWLVVFGRSFMLTTSCVCARISMPFLLLLGSQPGIPWGWAGCRSQRVFVCVLLSTSLRVRKDIEDWVISETGDCEKVELDIQDLCKHKTPPSGTGCSLYSTAMLRNLAVSPW